MDQRTGPTTLNEIQSVPLQEGNCDSANEQDMAAVDDQGEWTDWQRKRPSKKNKTSQLDRVSRTRFTLLLRPLQKIQVSDIPKAALATAVGLSAPTEELAELATHKYDPAGNSIVITVYDEEHASRLTRVTKLAYRANQKIHTITVEVKPNNSQPNTSKGVITVEPEDDNETIYRWLRCEQAEVIQVQRIGKTNKATLTFDSPTLPKVVKYYTALVKVAEYTPKRMVCYNCHEVGHMAKYCPRQGVCKNCGHSHTEEDECEREHYCAACKITGHLALSPTCPSRAPISRPKNTRVKEGVSWADMARNNNTQQVQDSSSQPDSTAASSINQQVMVQLDALRRELQQVREENQRLKAELQALRTPITKNPLRSPSAPRNATRPSRSASSKRTPTSQPRKPSNEPRTDLTHIIQILAQIRTDIQRESRTRQQEIEKLKITTEQNMSQTTAMLSYLSDRIQPVTDPDDTRRRKLALPRTANHD